MDADWDWDGLEQQLRRLVRVTDEECAYLKKAFRVTERMWAENVAKITEVRVVMLAEAPQFGRYERYFYNPATPFSSFLYFRDAEAILGRDLTKEPRDKRFLLPELARAGFIILDLFPFALNKHDTPSITYNLMSTRLYQQLFQRTAERYFDRKRDLILQLGDPLFLFRYEGMKDRLGALVDAELSKRKIASTQSVGGTNMSLDRKKLNLICRAAKITPVADPDASRKTVYAQNTNPNLVPTSE